MDWIDFLAVNFMTVAVLYSVYIFFFLEVD